MEVVLTEQNFEQEVLQSDVPVLVDFWAEWCGPCRMLAPAVAQIAEEYAGKVKVGKLNIDENMGPAIEYGVEAIPTLILFRNGKPAAKSVGLISKSQIASILD